MKNENETLKEKEEISKTKMNETSKAFDEINKIPSMQSMLKHNKNLEEYKSLLASIQFEDTKEISDYTKNILSESTKNIKKKLDCKHLSLLEIDAYFKKYETRISQIYDGKQYCERHIRFKKQVKSKAFSRCSLTYNVSMITFTFEQHDYMARLMRKHFEGAEVILSSNSEYYFKVLIPEFCLLIFNDVYNMNREEGLDYLNNMSLE